MHVTMTCCQQNISYKNSRTGSQWLDQWCHCLSLFFPNRSNQYHLLSILQHWFEGYELENYGKINPGVAVLGLTTHVLRMLFIYTFSTWNINSLIKLVQGVMNHIWHMIWHHFVADDDPVKVLRSWPDSNVCRVSTTKWSVQRDSQDIYKK